MEAKDWTVGTVECGLHPKFVILGEGPGADLIMFHHDGSFCYLLASRDMQANELRQTNEQYSAFIHTLTSPVTTLFQGGKAPWQT